MFEIVEFHWADPEALGFLLLCEALFDACITQSFTRAPAFVVIRTHLALAFAELARPHSRLASTIAARYGVREFRSSTFRTNNLDHHHSPFFSARSRSCGRAHWFLKTRTFFPPVLFKKLRGREGRDSTRSEAPPPMSACVAVQFRRDGAKRSLRTGAAELSKARARRRGGEIFSAAPLARYEKS